MAQDSAIPEVSKGEERVPYVNLDNILKMGSGFFLIFTAFSAQQNLAPQLLRDLGYGNLGFASIAVLYSVFVVSCFTAPAVLRCIGERRLMPLATLGYALFCASGLLPASCSSCPAASITGLVLLSSAIIGFCGALLWVPQGALMTYNSPQPFVNLYTAIFQVMFQSAFLVGPAISAVVIDRPVLFFVLFTAISLAGTLVLCAIREPQRHPSIPLPEPKEPASCREILGPLASFLRTDARALPVAAYSALLGAFFNCVPACVLPLFAPSIVAAALMLTLLGVGNLIGSFSFARLSNAFGRLATMLLATSCQTLALALLVLGRVALSDLLELGLVASAVMGFGNSLHFSNCDACIASAVHDKVHAAFALKQAALSLITVPGFLLLPLLDGTVAAIVVMIVLAICTLLLACSPKFFQTLAVTPKSAPALEAAKTNVQDPPEFSDFSIVL